MSKINNRMTAYEAPDGYVFDYAEPRIAYIKTDGVLEEVEEHIYAKYLYLGKSDDINNYKMIEDPRCQKN